MCIYGRPLLRRTNMADSNRGEKSCKYREGQICPFPLHLNSYINISTYTNTFIYKIQIDATTQAARSSQQHQTPSCASTMAVSPERHLQLCQLRTNKS